MSCETPELKREGAPAWLTLNRPDSLDALDAKLVGELRHFFSRLPEARDLRGVVKREGVRALLEKRPARCADR